MRTAVCAPWVYSRTKAWPCWTVRIDVVPQSSPDAKGMLNDEAERLPALSMMGGTKCGVEWVRIYALPHQLPHSGVSSLLQYRLKFESNKHELGCRDLWELTAARRIRTEVWL